MKIEIKNRGPGKVRRLVLEPSTTQGLVTLSIFQIEYNLNEPIKALLSDVTVSAPELKAGMDSLAKVCKKPKD